MENMVEMTKFVELEGDSFDFTIRSCEPITYLETYCKGITYMVCDQLNTGDIVILDYVLKLFNISYTIVGLSYGWVPEGDSPQITPSVLDVEKGLYKITVQNLSFISDRLPYFPEHEGGVLI